MTSFQPSYGAGYGVNFGDDEDESESAPTGKGSADYTKLIEAGAGLLTSVGTKALTARGDKKRADAEAKRQRAMEKERVKTLAAQSKLVEAQAKLAAAQKPEAPETPAWVLPVALVSGLGVLGLIGFLALRKK
jgi:hypothetical protein